MAHLLRWTLITMLLLRMALGNGWAMQSVPVPQAPQDGTSMRLPCHTAPAVEATAHTTADESAGHVAASMHGHGAHCVLCFPALHHPLLLVLAPVKHAHPTSEDAVSAQWLRAPDLRPPI